MVKIRLMVVEDNRIWREGITAMIDEQADMKVVAAIGSNDDALRKAHKVKPHVVLLDLGLQNHKGMSLLESMREEIPQVKVIGMDLIPLQSDIIEFVEAGASGFILKDATVGDFLRTVRWVAQGKKILPPPLAGSLFSQVVEHAIKKGKVPQSVRMTKREREIIILIAEGLSNKEIAQKINISTHTVKSHVHNILGKLALQTRLQIAQYAAP